MLSLLLLVVPSLLGISSAVKTSQSQGQPFQTFEALACSTAYGLGSIKPVPHTTLSVTSQVTVTATLTPGNTAGNATTASASEGSATSSSTIIPNADTKASSGDLSKQKRAAAAKPSKSYATAIICTKSVLLVATTTITATSSSPATTAATSSSSASTTSTPSYFNLQVSGGDYDGKYAVLDTYNDLSGDYYMAAIDGQDGASPFELDNGTLIWSNGGGIPWYANQEPGLTEYTDGTVMYFSSVKGGKLGGASQPTCSIDDNGLLQCVNSRGRSVWETCYSQQDYYDGESPYIDFTDQVESGCTGVNLAVVSIQL